MIRFRRSAPGKGLPDVSKAERPEPPPYPSLFHFHIPKTAGTSLRRLLEDNLSIADSCEALRLLTLFSEQLEAPPFPRVSRGMLSGHVPIETLDRFDSPVISIVTVREPVSLIRSNFYQFKRDGVLPPSMPFQKFLFSGGANNMCNFQCRWLAGFQTPGFPTISEEPRSHEEILAECAPFLDGRVAEAAGNSLRRFTFVLLTDRLDEGLRRLAQRLDLLRAIDLEPDNVGPPDQGDGALDERATNLVDAVTAGDRELYKLAETLYEQQAGPVAPINCELFSTKHILPGMEEIWCNDFSYPISGEGWHRRELSLGWGGFRWSTGKSTIRVRCNLEAGRKYSFKLFVLGTPDERNLKESYVVLGDNRIPLLFRRVDTAFHGGGEFVPKTSLSNDVSAELHVPHACPPPPVSATVFDRRTLGFAVKWMGIFTLLSANGHESPVAHGLAVHRE